MNKKIATLGRRLVRYIQKMDRISMIWYGAVAFALILLFNALSFTVIDHEFYKAFADKQQRTTIQNPVSRGTISSSQASLNGIFAISTNLGSLTIDPSQSGSTQKLLDFLSDAILNDFCAQNLSSEECLHKIESYVRQPIDPTLPQNSASLKKIIEAYLEGRMSAPIESVLVVENLDEETIKSLSEWDDPSLFFVVNNLYVNPTKVQDKDILAQKLSDFLHIPQEEILPKLLIRQKRYLEVIRKMNLSTRNMVNKFLETNQEHTQKYIQEGQKKVQTTQEKNKVKQEMIMEYAVYPFVRIEDNLMRYYPEGGSIGQITGFVNNEGIGKYGIEGYFENLLQGESPIQVITKDIRGRIIRDYASGGLLTMKNGIDIHLTIDRNIQKELSKIMERNTKKFGANRGSVIVMDPKTGAVTAMVNFPSFDPNNFTEVYEMEPVMYDQYPDPIKSLFGFPLFVIDDEAGTMSTNIEGKRLKLREANDNEMGNYAIQKYKYKSGYGDGNYQNNVISALYEPGSVFKAITVAIGLDTNEIRPNDTYYDKNYVELDFGGGFKQRIQNLDKGRCGGLHTYAHALNWSCNVGMVHIIEKIGRSLFYKYATDFGFNMKTNITMAGEVFGSIAPPDKWSRLQFFTMAFGQGINMTMIQLATAYSVLANGGIYMQPYIIEALDYPDGRMIQSVPTPIRRVIKEETSKTITAMLVDGAQNGFAAKGGIPGYVIAGKTGTSQIPYRGTYENIYFRQNNGHTITSFGGYAPAYNPKFVMIIRFERPRTSIYAEQTAAAAWSEAAQYLLNYYKIPRNK